jgi:hypothetical protein
MEVKDPLMEFVKALARRQARLDALPPKPANDDQKASKQVEKS